MDDAQARIYEQQILAGADVKFRDPHPCESNRV